LIDLHHNLWSAAKRDIPKAGSCRIRICGTNRELLAGSGIFCEENACRCGFNIIRLMDFVVCLDRIVVTFDKHGKGRDDSRIVRIEHHLPDTSIRGTTCLWSPGSAASGVDDVNHVFETGSFIVGNILHADKLEDAVDITPVFQHPLWAVNSERRDASKVALPGAVGRWEWISKISGLDG
jgi:hypothetical protein